MTTFDRYLLRRFMHVFGILFVTTFGLFMVIDGFTNVDAFQQDSNGALSVLSKMAGYYLYQSSIFFEMIGPILTVISVMVVFALLVRHSEIHPLLAAGIPTYRLVVPLLVGAALVNAGLIANQDLLIPRISQRLQEGRKSGSAGHDVEPVYDHATHILIAGKKLFLALGRMREAKFLLPAPGIAQELTSLKSREAIYCKPTTGRPAGWLLRGVTPRLADVRLTPQGKRVVKAQDDPNDVFVATDVSCDQLYNRSRNYRFVSTLELIRRTRHPAHAIVSIRGQSLHLHARLMRPFINLVAVRIAVPLIVRRESPGLVTNLAVCAAVLSMVFGITQVFQYLGGANLIACDLAAWAPVILGGTLGAWLSGSVQT